MKITFLKRAHMSGTTSTTTELNAFVKKRLLQKDRAVDAKPTDMETSLLLGIPPQLIFFALRC